MNGWNEDATRKVEASLLPLVETAVAGSGITDQQLAEIVIADEANYGSAISEFSPGEGYTNVGELLGVGKTLPFVGAHGQINNRVVLRAEMVDALLEINSPRKTEKEVGPDILLAAHVLSHELGHCIDNVTRPLAAVRKRTLGNRFKISSFADYYGSIAIEEFAACTFSSRSINAAMLIRQFDNDARSVGNEVAKVRQRRENYAGAHELLSLACQAASTFWTSLIQAGKVFAWRNGNEELRNVPLEWGQWYDSDAGDVLLLLEMELAQSWNGYPDDLKDFETKLINAWKDIAFEEGFRFVEGSESDGVYF